MSHPIPVARFGGKLIRVLLLAAAVALVALAISDEANHDHRGATGPAPALTWRGPDGSARSLSESGRPVVVNFWATWCPPCRAELPDLAAAARKHQGRVDFVGVAVQSEPELAKAMAEHHGLTYPIVFGSPATQATWGVQVLPTTFIVDAKGEIVWARAGMIDGATLDDVLAPLMTGRCGSEVC